MQDQICQHFQTCLESTKVPFKCWVLTRAPLILWFDSGVHFVSALLRQQPGWALPLTLSDQPASCSRPPPPPNHVWPPLRRPSLQLLHPGPSCPGGVPAGVGAFPNWKLAHSVRQLKACSTCTSPGSPPHLACALGQPCFCETTGAIAQAAYSPSSRTRSSENHRVGQKAVSSAPAPQLPRSAAWEHRPAAPSSASLPPACPLGSTHCCRPARTLSH